MASSVSKVIYETYGLIKLGGKVTDLRLELELILNTQLGPPEIVSPGYGGLPKGLLSLGCSLVTSYLIDEYESPLSSEKTVDRAYNTNM